MKITKELFERSFFMMGGGFDIEPMLRFSHVTDWFINVNLFIEQRDVISWYDRAFKFSDFEVLRKEVIDDFREDTHFELHPDYIRHLMHPDFMKPRHLESYLHTFSQAVSLKQYAILYTLRRKSVNRIIHFYFCTAEAIASYITLSQNGAYAPYALSTIVTGVLENPRGLLNELFSRDTVKKPRLWVRGFEPGYVPFRMPDYTLDEAGVFHKKALDFNAKWMCGWSYDMQQTTVRHCRGFVTDAGFEELRQMQLKDEYKSERHRLVFERLGENGEGFGEHDILVISRKTRLHEGCSAANILYWEDFTYNHRWWRLYDAGMQIDSLKERLAQRALPEGVTLHMVPFCLEDQGQLYFEAVQGLDYKTITYAPNLFDFIDLKE
jgi:hypothetical protein